MCKYTTYPTFSALQGCKPDVLPNEIGHGLSPVFQQREITGIKVGKLVLVAYIGLSELEATIEIFVPKRLVARVLVSAPFGRAAILPPSEWYAYLYIIVRDVIAHCRSRKYVRILIIDFPIGFPQNPKLIAVVEQNKTKQKRF